MVNKKSGKKFGKKPEKKPEEKPGLDPNVEDQVKKWEERQKIPKEKPKTHSAPHIINNSILDSLKESNKQAPFVGHGGMWVSVYDAYRSCTDEFGKLTTSVDKLQKKIDSAQKGYFNRNFGEWHVGTQKEDGMTIGDIIYKQYLGDVGRTFKPLRDIPKEELSPDMITKNALEPLVGHFSEKIKEIHQYRIINLEEDEKEKLREELVKKAGELGRPLTKTEMLSDQSLLQAVGLALQEERKKDYEKLTQGKSLLEGYR